MSPVTRIGEIKETFHIDGIKHSSRDNLEILVKTGVKINPQL